MSCKIMPSSETGGVESYNWGQPQDSKRSRNQSPSPQSTGQQGADCPDDWQKQVELAHNQGVAEGRRQVEDAVRAQFQSEISKVSERLGASLAEISVLRGKLRHQAEVQMVELALEVARKILHRQIAMDSDALSGLVKAAVAKIDARELLEIRVSPAHHASVKAYLDRLGLPSQVQVVSDQALEPGALLLETDRGRLDASVSTQLAEIERGFADYLALEGGR